MAIRTAHALFHSKTLENAIRGFTFPMDLEARHAKVRKWAEALASGTLDHIKEISLHGDFLHDVFQAALGYHSVIEGAGRVWEIHAEQTISEGGGSADGALGLFTAAVPSAKSKGKVSLEGRVIAPIELKAVRSDLDRPSAGRRESAVEQGWRYANYTKGCRWILISNYQEIRLYETTRTPAYFERFLLSELADIEAFKRFYFLLCRGNFLPLTAVAKDTSATDRLLAESQEAQESITDKLYREYKQLRLDLAAHFRAHGPKDLPDRDPVLIEKAQKLLDRVLFIAFCEDRRLLPKKTLAEAHDHRDRYNPRPVWENFRSVFRWVDRGNEDPRVPAYNGGLFKLDPLLDEQLTVPDALCTRLKELTRFDFDTDVSVDVLGHIFEQSITDLEELKAQATGRDYDEKRGTRKTQGVFYTPAYITQYIVDVALGGYLERRAQEIRERLELDAIPERATRRRQEAETRFWETYRDEVLKKTRIIDPACGSGAFLIAAFDHLAQQYERVNRALEAAGGQRALFDLNETILNGNLYGVDLSPESVEITKLSLWLKTAAWGKALTYLDDNIVVGNSVVEDSAYSPQAFRWRERFPKVFAEGGFDVVIGNPPYVRQELLTPIKPYLQTHYASFDGVADLYTYFYELGIKILRPGGVMSYIVTNKWLRSGYGEPLRRFFARNGVLEQLVDFGHAPIFQDADTFPCIVAVRRPARALDAPEVQAEPETPVTVCSVPRERLSSINLRQYVQESGFAVPWSRFSAEAWSLEPPAVEALMEKIRRGGVPLREFVGTKSLRGVVTGFNEAFLIDDETKRRLVSEDPGCAEIIKPYLRGQDVQRWVPHWRDSWMIFARRGIDIDRYPSVKRHLLKFRDGLEPRPANWTEGQWPGRKPGPYQWYEIQDSIDYWQLFSSPKLIYQEIQFHPSFAFDDRGMYLNNKAFMLCRADLYLLAVLNSPLMWWHNWRYLPHMKDEALSPVGYLMEQLPIAPPSDLLRAELEPLSERLILLTQESGETHREVLDWLRVERGIEKPGQKLEDFASLEPDEFIAEVKKRQPKSVGSLTPAALKVLRQVYSDYVPALRKRQKEALGIEHRISALVMTAYQLTPEEIALLWRTAPPRMPIGPGEGEGG